MASVLVWNKISHCSVDFVFKNKYIFLQTNFKTNKFAENVLKYFKIYNENYMVIWQLSKIHYYRKFNTYYSIRKNIQNFTILLNLNIVVIYLTTIHNRKVKKNLRFVDPVGMSTTQNVYRYVLYTYINILYVA